MSNYEGMKTEFRNILQQVADDAAAAEREKIIATVTRELFLESRLPAFEEYFIVRCRHRMLCRSLACMLAGKIDTNEFKKFMKECGYDE